MSKYITGEAIQTLRESLGLTQKQLADQLGVTDKAVSKWETGRGLPDITLLPSIADAFHMSVAELLAGEKVINRNRAGNLSRACLYVCPVCGNTIFSTGEAAISCCGIGLPVLESEESLDELDLSLEIADGEIYVRAEHPMRKDHFLGFFAYVTTDHVFFRKLYPEQAAEARFPYKGLGTLYSFCNKQGLMAQKIKAIPRQSPIRQLV